MHLPKLVLVVAAVLCLFQPGSTQTVCDGPRSKGELLRALLADYDPIVSPVQAADVDDIDDTNNTLNFDFNILKMRDVNPSAQSFEIEFILRRTWNDWRLRFNSTDEGGCFNAIDLDGASDDLSDIIWMPLFDIVEIEDRKLADLLRIRITSEGEVTVRHLYLYKMHCELDIEKFPYDKHSCPLEILSSASFDAGDVVIETDRLVSSDEYSVSNTLVERKAGRITTIVTIRIFIEHNAYYYEQYLLAPLYLFLFVGYSSFFIDKKAAPARCALTIVAVLVCVNYVSFMSNTLPRVPQRVWLLDLTLSISILVSVCLLEYAVVNMATQRLAIRKEKAKQKEELKRQGTVEMDNLQESQQDENKPIAEKEQPSKWDKLIEKFLVFCSRDLDLVSIFLYPIIVAIILSVEFSSVK